MFNKILITVFALLTFTTSSFATFSPSNGPSIGIGGGSVANTNLMAPGAPAVITPEGSLGTAAEWFTLSSNVVASGPSYYYHFVKWGVNAGQYQVPAGQTLHCVDVASKSNTAEVAFLLGYSTAVFADNSPTVPTAPVYFGKVDTGALTNSSTTEAYSYFRGAMTFPQNTFPFMETMSNAANYRTYLTCRLTTP